MNQDKVPFKSPAFFPKGTVVEYQYWSKDPAKQLTVASVMQTEMTSFVLCAAKCGNEDTDMLVPLINTEHVTKIIKRGSGEVVFKEPYKIFPLYVDNWACNCLNTAKPKTCYAGLDVHDIITYQVNKYLPYYTMADIDAVASALKLSGICRQVATGFELPTHVWLVNKKRLRKWVKANINRYLLTKKKIIALSEEEYSGICDRYSDTPVSDLKQVILKNAPKDAWWAWSINADERTVSCLPYPSIGNDPDSMFVHDLKTFPYAEIENIADIDQSASISSDELFHYDNANPIDNVVDVPAVSEETIKQERDLNFDEITTNLTFVKHDVTVHRDPSLTYPYNQTCTITPIVKMPSEEYFKDVFVRFDLTNDIWDVVVGQNQEVMAVETEGSDTFIVSYATQHDFDKAVARFNGMIKYEIVQEDTSI